MVATTFTALAQEIVHQVDDITVINYGDGRLLFREFNKDKAPLNGQHRIIDGYRSEYVLADFKDGMYDGNFQHFKNNKLKEQGTYKQGRKDGIYKEYYFDGVAVKVETPYKEGKINGIRRSYYTNGKPEKEKGYEMSVEHGIERLYSYDSRNITERNYKDGRQHGAQIIFYSSNTGDFVERSTYDNGKRVGKYSETFTNGTIKKLGQYNAQGERDGEWLEQDSFSAKNNDTFSGKRTVYKNGDVIEDETIKDFIKFQRKK